MRELTQETPGRIPDLTVTPVREQRIAVGKVRLITPQNEETECNAQTN